MSPIPIGNYPSADPATAPTPGSALTFNGGTKVSTSNNSFFNDEKLGDVMLYAKNASQQILLGNPTNDGRSAMSLSRDTNGANTINCHSTLYCPNFIGTTGISISLGTPLGGVLGDESIGGPKLTQEIMQLTSDTITAKCIAASNQVFVPMMMEAYYSNMANGLCNLYSVSNVAFRPPVTFCCNVTMCNGASLALLGNLNVSSNMNLAPTSMITIGSNANAGLYPINVQTATATGGVSIYAAGDISAFSDARWKEDVVPIVDALEKVRAIGGYTFHRTGMPLQKRLAGVLAQEVQAVLPEVVDADGDGRLHVAYGNISALLIEATKALDRRVDERQAVLRVVTTSADEAFSLPLPASLIAAGASAAFVCGVDVYSRCTAAIADGCVVGRVEAPGTYNVLVL